MSLSRMNYKEYPEYMFAMIAAYLPASEGDDLRRVSGDIVFRYTDERGCTYKNGALHSFEGKPSVPGPYQKMWHRDGEVHRDSDLPAVINEEFHIWCHYIQVEREL